MTDHPTTPPPGGPHPGDDRLHDLADGRLDAPAREAVERHLASCAACAARHARLRRLLAAAAALPRELDTAVDGWPGLRAALHARAERRRVRVRLLAAAALLVAAVGAWGSWSAWRASDEATATPGADPAFAAVERDYARAAAELAAQVAATRHRLPVEVAASVDRSLATIDGALAEASAALRDDPGNPDLAHFVAASYERKLDLLRRTAAITSGD